MEYDFIALARQIEERFIRGKPRINADVSKILTSKLILKALLDYSFAIVYQIFLFIRLPQISMIVKEIRITPQLI